MEKIEEERRRGLEGSEEEAIRVMSNISPSFHWNMRSQEGVSK